MQSGYSPSSPSKVDASGRLYSPVNGVYRASGVPDSADYYVEATLYKVTTIGSETIGILARAQASAATFYTARWSESAQRWELYKVVSTTATLLGQSSLSTFSVGETKVLRLTVAGSDLQVAVNGVAVIGGPSSPITDSAITTAGFAGIRGSPTTSQTATTGIHVDSISAGALPPPPFLLDTFTDVSNTPITAHTGETGATWALQSGYSPSSPSKIDASGRLYSVANGVYRASGVPSSANYYVEATLYKVTTVSSETIGVIARAQASSATFYTARWSESAQRWELYKVVSTTATLLGHSSLSTFSVGETKVLRLTVAGSDLRVAVNGVAVIGGPSSPIADSAITTAGFVGIRGSPTTSQTATTGIHVDGISAGGE